MDNLEGIESPMFEFMQQAEKLRNKGTPTKKAVDSNEKKSHRNSEKKNVAKDVKQALFQEEEDKIGSDPHSELEEIIMKIKTLEEVKDYVEQKLTSVDQIDET